MPARRKPAPDRFQPQLAKTGRSVTIPEIISLVLMFGVALVFVFDVNDGTFLKLPLCLAGCSALLAFGAAEAIRAGTLEIQWSRYHTILAAFILCSALSIAGSQNSSLSVMALLLSCCVPVLFSTGFTSLNFERFSKFASILAGCTVVVALGHFFIPEDGSWGAVASQLGTISTLGNQTYYSGFLVLLLPVIAARWMKLESSSWQKIALAVLMLSIGYLLVETGSRSAWAAALAAMALMLWFGIPRGRPRMWSLVILCAIIGLAAVFFHDTIGRRISLAFTFDAHSSLARRLFFYEAAWKAFLASPLYGNGLGNFILFLPRFRSPEYWMFRSEDIVPHAHNELLEILSETGIIGLLPYLLFLGALLAGLVRSFKSAAGPDRTVILGLGCSLLAVQIDNIASMNLRTIPVFCLFWLVAGMAARMTGTDVQRFQAPVPRGARFLQWAPAAGLLWIVFELASSAANQYRIERDYLDGFLLRYNGQIQTAEERFRSVLARDPHHPEAHFYLASILIQSVRPQPALGHLDTLLHDYPWYPKARTLRAIAQLDVRDTAGALRSISEEELMDKSLQTRYYAAIIYGEAGRPDDEREEYIRILRSNLGSGLTDFCAESAERLGRLRLTPGAVTELRELGPKIVQKFPTDTLIQGKISGLLRAVDSVGNSLH